MVAEESDVEAVMEAVTYAFGHLALSVQKGRCSPENLHSKERLLVYMARYMAWARDSFQKDDAFLGLLEDSSEFAVAMVFSSRAASGAPWSEIVDDDAGSGTSKSVVTSTSATHILSRNCSNCGFRGVMCIYCTSCGMYDVEVGLQIGSSSATEGAQRLTGSKTAFTYTCKWCQYKQTCNSSYQYFSDPRAGGSYQNYSYNNTLFCRKCNMFGCRGCMTVL